MANSNEIRSHLVYRLFSLHTTRNVVSKEFDFKLLSAADLLEPPKTVYTHQASAKTSLAV